MRYLLLWLFFAGATNASNAQNNWKIIPGASSVTFVIKNGGFKVDGSLGELKANITFNKQDVSLSNIQATVSTATIDTDNSLRDSHLKKPDYFNVEKYPAITMQSTAISKAGDAYKGNFNLTIKGITKNVEVPFTVSEQGKTATFSGTFFINRRDFSVGGKSWLLSDNVVITLKVAATQ